MLTTILSALCALTLSGNIATAQADTLNVYMINGDKITNFDGSQLVGKTVSEYRIGIHQQCHKRSHQDSYDKDR